jgi:hypothetical protein
MAKRVGNVRYITFNPPGLNVEIKILKSGGQKVDPEDFLLPAA